MDIFNRILDLIIKDFHTIFFEKRWILNHSPSVWPKIKKKRLSFDRKEEVSYNFMFY